VSQTDGPLPSIEEVLDTVTPPSVGRPNGEMDTIGRSYALGMLLLLLPFLPYLALAWLANRLFSALDPR